MFTEKGDSLLAVKNAATFARFLPYCLHFSDAGCNTRYMLSLYSMQGNGRRRHIPPLQKMSKSRILYLRHFPCVCPWRKTFFLLLSIALKFCPSFCTAVVGLHFSYTFMP